MSFANLKRSSKANFKSLADKMTQESKGSSFSDDRIWTPDIDKSGSGFAIIRFLPEADGEDFPYVKTYTHGFKQGNKWFIENCPTTIGNPCPVCEANSELWNTEIKENQEIVRRRKRSLRYMSNIIVLSDSKRPENEGRVFLFSYGQKIFDKLMSAIKPEFDDEEPFNPFDLWGGAPFKLKIRQVEGFRNYDKSEFGDRGPLFDDDDAMAKVWESQYKLKEFLAPARFNPYEEIKKRFNAFIKGGTYTTPTPQNEGDQNEDTPPWEPPAQEPRRQAARKDPAPASEAAASDDDDDFKMFRSLIDD
jgi:hypothetical protein